MLITENPGMHERGSHNRYTIIKQLRCFAAVIMVTLCLTSFVSSATVINHESGQDIQGKNVRVGLLLLPSAPPDEGSTRFGLETDTLIYTGIGDSARFRKKDANDTQGALDLQDWDLIYFRWREIELGGRRFSKSPKSIENGWVVVIKPAPLWPLRNTIELEPKFQEIVRIGGASSDYHIDISFDIHISGSIEYVDQFGRWKLTEQGKIMEGSSVRSYLYKKEKLVMSRAATITGVTDGTYGTEFICNGEIIFLPSQGYREVVERFLLDFETQRGYVCARLNQNENQRHFFSWMKDCSSPSARDNKNFAAASQWANIRDTGFDIYGRSNFRILYSPYRFALPLFSGFLLSSQPAAPQSSMEWETINEEVMSLYRRGNYDEAVVVAKKALDVAEHSFGRDHPFVAASLNNLAELYQTQGQYAAAEPLFKRALAINEKARGPDHPEVATSLNNLAELYRTQGQYAQAEPLYKRSLAIKEKALGREHPGVATSLENMAALYRKTDRIKEAEGLEARAARVRAIKR